jgi:hypothetical protein
VLYRGVDETVCYLTIRIYRGNEIADFDLGFGCLWLLLVLNTVSVFVYTHMHWLHYFGVLERRNDTHTLDHGLFMY